MHIQMPHHFGELRLLGAAVDADQNLVRPTSVTVAHVATEVALRLRRPVLLIMIVLGICILS